MTNFVRHAIETSAFDGALLSAVALTRADLPLRAPGHASAPPLVILPGHFRPARMLEPLAEMLVGFENGPSRVLLVDYRGRGASAPRENPAHYTPRNEAQDVVSLLDGLNWHEVDVLASARGGLVAMALSGSRPALIRRLILNDIGPELDGVGLARLKTAAARERTPANWDEASDRVKRTAGTRYPALTDRDYERLARLEYDDANGSPRSRVDPSVFAHFAGIDLDDRYPTLWPEFRALRRRPVTLLRAEYSDILNDAIVERMREAHPELDVLPVPGQGHAPVLDRDGWPERIGSMLAR